MPVEVRDVSGHTATQFVEFTKGTLDLNERLEYDPNGNMTNWIQAGVTNAFSYDPENQLVKVESNGTAVLECWYDYAGRRIAKKETIGGSTNAVQYVYDDWTIVAVLNGQGQLLEYYTRGVGIAGDIGSIVAETRFTNGHSIATCYYHHNHRGDVTFARSGTNTLATYDYAPFGEARTTTGSYSARFRFSSKEGGSIPFLVNYGYRMYLPSVGRFLNPDPLLDHSSKLITFHLVNGTDFRNGALAIFANNVNAYVNCGNNMISSVDYLGFFTTDTNDPIRFCVTNYPFGRIDPRHTNNLITAYNKNRKCNSGADVVITVLSTWDNAPGWCSFLGPIQLLLNLFTINNDMGTNSSCCDK